MPKVIMMGSRWPMGSETATHWAKRWARRLVMRKGSATRLATGLGSRTLMGSVRHWAIMREIQKSLATSSLKGSDLARPKPKATGWATHWVMHWVTPKD